MKEPTPGYLSPIAVKRTGGYDRDGRALWRLTEPSLYYSASRKQWLMTPEGFITNFASVPRFPIVYWWYGDRCWEEPAGHDFPYTFHGVVVVDVDLDTGRWSNPRFTPVTRKEADDLFLEALLLNPNTPDGMDYTMHKGVRLGGGSSWDGEADPNIVQPPEVVALCRLREYNAASLLASTSPMSTL